MDNRRKGYVILAIFYIYILFVVTTIMIDLPNVLNPFYLPSGKTIVPLAISYPAISNGQLQADWLQISFDLETETNSLLAEGVNVTMTDLRAEAFINDVSNDTSPWYITDVWVGFQYAQPWSDWVIGANVSGQYQFHYYTALDGDWLSYRPNATVWLSNGTHPLGMYPLVVFEKMTFNFPSSGEYSPSVLIDLANNTILSYTYDQVKVHVISASEVQTQKLERIGAAVTVALLVFAIVEGVVAVKDLTKERYVPDPD
jgi:hypothetical protein